MCMSLIFSQLQNSMDRWFFQDIYCGFAAFTLPLRQFNRLTIMKTPTAFRTAIVITMMTVAATSFSQTIGKLPDPKPTGVIIPKQPKPNPDKKKAPSNQRVEFVYSPVSHTGTFDFCNSNVQSLSVEIENQMSGEIHYGSVDVSYPVMDVCLEPASYSITCTAEDGSLYAGEFDIY